MVDRGMVAVRVSVLSVGVVAFLAGVSWAGTINVPDDYATIQEAIDHAQTGDEVVAQPDTYTENLDFKGKAIIVRSTDPTDSYVVGSTNIDGGGAGPVVTFDSGETSASQLLGFLITGGVAAQGAGILCDGASPTIAYNDLFENGAWRGDLLPLEQRGDRAQHHRVELRAQRGRHLLRVLIADHPGQRTHGE